jgi:hypothetical protein
MVNSLIGFYLTDGRLYILEHFDSLLHGFVFARIEQDSHAFPSVRDNEGAFCVMYLFEEGSNASPKLGHWPDVFVDPKSFHMAPHINNVHYSVLNM